MYKLKDIFTLNLNTRGGVKLFNKIANKYNLHKEDRKDLMNLEVGSSEDAKGFEYKSSKVCWKIDPLTEEQTYMAISLVSELLVIPLYSSLLVTYDGNFSDWNKYYANFTHIPLVKYCAKLQSYALYIEENIFIGQFDFSGTIIENPSISKIFETLGVTEDMLYEMAGIKRIPYEEYMNLRVDEEIGKDLINE